MYTYIQEVKASKELDIKPDYAFDIVGKIKELLS
jgi:hypothetical protein